MPGKPVFLIRRLSTFASESDDTCPRTASQWRLGSPWLQRSSVRADADESARISAAAARAPITSIRNRRLLPPTNGELYQSRMRGPDYHVAPVSTAVVTGGAGFLGS